MARIANPANETGRRRTEKYREEQARRRRPEASHVDRALAAAVAVSCRLADPSDPSPEVQNVLRLAKEILKRQGFDGRETLLKIKSRVLYRQDLPELVAISPAPEKSLGGASL